MKIYVRFKGGKGSGDHGHKGRPGKQGGSGGGGDLSSEQITVCCDKIKTLISSGGDVGEIAFTSSEREFLAATVTGDVTLYRGIGLVKGRVTSEQMAEAKTLKPGDPAPAWLAKQYNDIASYTHKKSVAKYYSSGKISIIIAGTVPADKQVVDLKNIRKLLKSKGMEDQFDENDYGYFQREAEVLVKEPVSFNIESVK